VRPVNLIPPEQRRGERAPLRAGSFSYLLIAGLLLAVAAVTAVVLTGNTIKDREAQIADLEAREVAATAEAETLRGFADFAALSQAREQTVTSLAESRFDWERVLRELALVMPDDVWLVALSGAAANGTPPDNAAEVSVDPATEGPSMSMVGCATGHEAVARFLQTLKDIDGVTRVGVGKSELPTTQESSGSGGGEDCRTRDFITRFEIVVAFDEVPGRTLDAPAAPAPAPAAPTAPAAAGDGSGVAEAQGQEQQAREATAEQTGEAQQAANLVPGVAR
jgi:Tfp pilus assembly protein PilN